jgi:hydroxymethylglutaryl-CoA reductase (NADPH)
MGDAAGQNMVGRATFAACNSILDHYAGVANFFLESNFASDKKGSRVNMLRTRGKRVTAEATSTREELMRSFDVEPEQLMDHYGVANVGAFMAGANNNGGRIVRRHSLLRADAGWRTVRLADDSVADRGHARRRHGTGNAARVP